MDEDWCFKEVLLQSVEGILFRFTPMPGVYLFCEVIQWSSKAGVVTDEAAIESSETEEGTDVFEFLWSRPVRDSLEFDGIHSELTSL